MTLLDSAALALWRSLSASAGVTVTVTRSGETPIAITAVPGRSQHEEYDADGNMMTAWEDDWIVLAADLTIGGGDPVLPEPRDEITRTDETTVWRVLKRTGQRCYSPVDQTGKILRIHTKRTTA